VRLSTILVPTDFSAGAEAALERAAELAKAAGGRMVLLHAYPHGTAGADPFAYLYPVGLMESIERDAERKLLELCRKLEARGLRASGEVRLGSPSEEIVSAATRLGADLIVIGTRGLTGVKHALLGSVAERVVRHAHCPVLTVKS
jgi:nucleotide-binding universal stress UspA family protein